MLTKEKIVASIQKLPDNAGLDEVLDHIMLLAKIEQGLDQANEGKVISEQDMDERISKWLE